MSKRGFLADFGLVGLVVGGAATLTLGILTLGFGALLGRIPLTLGVLLAGTVLVWVTGLVITIATSWTRSPGHRAAGGEDAEP